ncbi:serine/arginine repetitive matrix protein 2 [Nasonia vitripennis]|uniref:Uncharacterized protein n=1 Tax=Nasonia vitripennis TaxID=7425 RepID=A0A7M7GHF5_NASVI|nr:serine/arginine repetitive matrix protein 2 [Nasonia vitripennis]
MSPRRTRRGTIRESSVIDISVDTSTKSANKSVRSTRRTRKNQNAKGSDEENDNPREVNNLTDNVTATSFSNDSTLSTRKQRRKVQESVLSQGISLSVTLDESKQKKSNLKTPNAKTQSKSSKSAKKEGDSLISEDESFNTKSQKDKKRVFYAMDNLISEDESVSQASSSKQAKSSNRRSKTPNKPSPSKKSITVKSTGGNVTPKSSPINVSFTPHRSTKTPKKSPINLGSPKTLPRSSLKLLNVQRKLSITDSPPSSENSYNLVEPQDSASPANKSAENTSMSDKKSKSTKIKSNSPTLKIRPRFSKSPKIVLKTLKAKSNKSPKKSLKVSPTKSEKSPAKSVKSPAKLSTSPKKVEKSPTKAVKSTTDTSFKVDDTSKDLSTVKTKLPKSESPQKFDKTPKADSSFKSQKSSSEKLFRSLLKVPSSTESRKSFLNTSLKSKTSSLSTSFKSKKSPLLNLSSKKMPKIVLNLKSNKSPLKSSKSISPSKAKKSPVKTPKLKSSMKMKKSPKSVSPTKKPSTNLILNKSISQDTSLSPRVVISKLTSHTSTPGIKSSVLNITGKQPSINLIPIDHNNQPSILPVKSPKSPKSLAKRSTIKSATPAKTVRTSMSAAKKVNAINTPSHVMEKKLLNMRPAKTSTPRDRNMKRTLTLASNKKITSPKQVSKSIILNGSPNSKSKVIKRLNNTSIQADNPLLEDESEPSLNGSSLIHMSDVFDSDNSKNNSTFSIDKSDLGISRKRKSINSPNISQKGNKSNTFEVKKNASNESIKEISKKDNTYELEHPKTPALQKRAKKRTLDEAELGITEEQESKKSCRVTFASPNLGNKVRSTGITRMGTPGHAIQQKKSPVSVNKNKTPVRKVEAKRRLSSVMKSHSKTVASTVEKRLSQIASVNRLSRPRGITDSEKKVAKTPVATKIPNFKEIHQKNFAKMESLVDLKKRVEQRHEVLNTATSSIKKKKPVESVKPLPLDSTNGAYSRFGFKLRKNEAVDIISKKQTGGVESREKKRENARSALKGVRMNRRFELQMKSRMKNT